MSDYINHNQHAKFVAYDKWQRRVAGTPKEHRHVPLCEHCLLPLTKGNEVEGAKR